MFNKILCLVLMCGVVLAVGCGADDPVGPSAKYEERLAESEETIRSLEQDLWETTHAPKSQTVVKATFKIPAGRYSDSIFAVTSNMKNARLKGSFRETANSPLYVSVFDDLNFRNWKAGGDSKVFYNSGKVVVGEIDLSIQVAGTYHLVFSNTHSWFTQKNVEAAVDLWYEI